MAKERFRRALRGYDPSQVDAAIEARDSRLRRLEREAQQLARRVIESEQRLQKALSRPGAADTPGAIGALSRRLEEIHAQARGQATRIRMKALQDVVQMTDRVSELAKLRDELSSRVLELAGLAGIRVGEGRDRPAVGTQPASASAGRARRERGSGQSVYAGPVRVEVGPFTDFSQLSRFEDAAAGIDGASEIKITRFSGGRATMSLNLDEPVELLRELEERAPFDFEVRATMRDGAVLDVDQPDQTRRAA